MFLIANAICADYTLATILIVVKRCLTIIQIVVPILLLIAGTVQFFKLTTNPDDDKKGLKKFINSIISAVIVFVLPFIVNLSMRLIAASGEVGISKDGNLTIFDITSCWSAVDAGYNQMEKSDDTKNNKTENQNTKKKKLK